MAIQIGSPCTANGSLVKTERERGGQNTLILGDNLRFLRTGRLLGTSVPGRGCHLGTNGVHEYQSCMCLRLFVTFVPSN